MMMQARTAERTIQKQLTLLQEDLARLQSRCAGLPMPLDITMALRQFKELGPAFEAVAAFTSVMRSNTGALDDERRQQVERQLLQLTVALWHLHLTVINPRLERMAAEMALMPVGTRYVLERWYKQLTAMQGESDIVAGLEPTLLANVASVTARLASEAPDLMDFGRG